MAQHSGRMGAHQAQQLFVSLLRRLAHEDITQRG
ncbi:hypothetical protein Save01_09180 [Streptomyces avermitilis]